MGYTTNFDGHLTITPALPAKLIEKINAFCEERHEGKTATNVGEIWCNWEVSADGTSIQWNGSEKAYGMFEWIKYLDTTYIKPAGSTMEGLIYAVGEDRSDQWKIIATITDGATKLVREDRPGGRKW